MNQKKNNEESFENSSLSESLADPFDPYQPSSQDSSKLHLEELAQKTAFHTQTTNNGDYESSSSQNDTFSFSPEERNNNLIQPIINQTPQAKAADVAFDEMSSIRRRVIFIILFIQNWQ